MTPDAVLLRLAKAGIVVSVEGGTLAYRAPAAAMTPENRALLRDHKDALVAFLAAQGARGPIEPLLLRLGLFGVEAELRGDDLWLVGRSPKDDPAVVLPPKLLEEAKARAEDIDRHLRAKEGRDAT